MPQESIPYAVGRLSVLTKDALNETKLERLLAAATPEEARRALAEAGWPEDADYEQQAREHVERACALVRALCPDKALADSFLLHYDVGNLKLLLKARCLGETAEDLSRSGTIDVETLRRAVADHSYGRLPEPLRAPMNALEKSLSVRVDPLQIDVTLDKALYNAVFSMLEPGRHAAAIAYYQARVDLTNALMTLRARRMGKDAAFLNAMLIEGGNVKRASFAHAMETPERLPGLLGRYGKGVRDAAQAAVLDGSLPALERAMDDHLLRVFTPYKHGEMRAEIIIGYLLACEREAAAVRLIMAGKANGFSEEAIRERLRELYG